LPCIDGGHTRCTAGPEGQSLSGDERIRDRDPGAADEVEQAAAEIVGLMARLIELDREKLRVHHAIGRVVWHLAHGPSRQPGSILKRCAVLASVSRTWIERHRHAYVAMQHRGQDVFERFLSRSTRKGAVLSPTQYLEYGGLRGGEARRAWRCALYGEDLLGNPQSMAGERMCAVRTFDGALVAETGRARNHG
jgi:hypothetical protein